MGQGVLPWAPSCCLPLPQHCKEALSSVLVQVFKEVDLDAAGGVDAYGVQDVAAKFGIPAFEFVKIDVEGENGADCSVGLQQWSEGSPCEREREAVAQMSPQQLRPLSDCWLGAPLPDLRPSHCWGAQVLRGGCSRRART